MEREDELAQLRRKGIEKFNILTLLQKEKNLLDKTLHGQEERQMNLAAYDSKEHDDDLKTLREISESQGKELQVLKERVRMSKLKSLPTGYLKCLAKKCQSNETP